MINLHKIFDKLLIKYLSVYTSKMASIYDIRTEYAEALVFDQND